MSKIQILIGSTRPNRVGPTIANWVSDHAQATFTSDEFELIDISDYNLPLLDEPKLPAAGDYVHEHTKKWAAKIAEADGYILVTPEYNHGYAAATKNALDFLYAEWNKKPIAFVGYGSVGGVRAVEQLRQVIVQLQMIGVSPALNIIDPGSHIQDDKFVPTEKYSGILSHIIEELIRLTSLTNKYRQV